MSLFPETEIKILGKFSTPFKTKHLEEQYETIKLESPMPPYCPEHPNLKNDSHYKIKPKKLFASGSLIAVIDCKIQSM